MTKEESMVHLEELLKDLEELNANEEFILQEEIKFNTIKALKILLKENQELKEKHNKLSKEFYNQNKLIHKLAKELTTYFDETEESIIKKLSEEKE